MLTVITPAASTALTTPARARAILGFANTEDMVAGRLIAQASQVVVDHCRRPFALETVRETFVDNDICGDGPMLARDPVVEIVSVTSNGAVLPAGGYRLDDRTGRLRRLDANGSVLPWWGGTLTIEYRAGYVLPTDASGGPAVTLPESVERAAIMLLSGYLAGRNRDPAIKSESVDGVSSTSWWVPGESDRLNSPEAAQLLSKYVRFYP